MLSYTGRRNLFGTLTQNTTSANLTVGDTLMNAADKRILALYQWPFLQTSATKTTSASVQAYEIPKIVSKLETLTVTYNSTVYSPHEVSSEREWQLINANSVQSDIPDYFYKRGEQVLLFPTPSAGGATITFYGRKNPVDLSVADYTTGTITTITNGSTTITGSGTTWTAGMVGRYIKIADGSAANLGDGQWYEIASRTSNSVIDLVKPYGGTSIATGTATYTIGQMPLLPEAYHELPVYDAVKTYFASIEPDYGKFQLYSQLYKQMEERLFLDYSIHTGDIRLRGIEINYE